MKRQHFKGYRNFHFTSATKVSVLHDQILILFDEQATETNLKTEAYISQIIDALKSDFAGDPGKLQMLDEIFYELKTDQPNKKKILSWLEKM